MSLCSSWIWTPWVSWIILYEKSNEDWDPSIPNNFIREMQNQTKIETQGHWPCARAWRKARWRHEVTTQDENINTKRNTNTVGGMNAWLKLDTHREEGNSSYKYDCLIIQTEIDMQKHMYANDGHFWTRATWLLASGHPQKRGGCSDAQVGVP